MEMNLLLTFPVLYCTVSALRRHRAIPHARHKTLLPVATFKVANKLSVPCSLYFLSKPQIFLLLVSKLQSIYVPI